MAASRVPINNNPGFWSRGSRVGFYYRDPHGQRRQATAATLTAAKALKSELETDVRRGDYRAESKITVADYVPAWVEGYRGRPVDSHIGRARGVRGVMSNRGQDRVDALR